MQVFCVGTVKKITWIYMKLVIAYRKQREQVYNWNRVSVCCRRTVINSLSIKEGERVEVKSRKSLKADDQCSCSLIENYKIRLNPFLFLCVIISVNNLCNCRTYDVMTCRLWCVDVRIYTFNVLNNAEQSLTQWL